MCWKFDGIFGCLPKFKRNDRGYTFAARPIAAQIYLIIKENYNFQLQKL